VIERKSSCAKQDSSAISRAPQCHILDVESDLIAVLNADTLRDFLPNVVAL